jgi:hypothetical protein
VLLGLATATLVLATLVWELNRSRLLAGLARTRALVRARRQAARQAGSLDYDPGRERRAEQRARALLRSCVGDREWAMYRDLGFLSVSGRSDERYAYLLYPHKPIMAYVPSTGALLNEYCVVFPDHTRPYGSARLPDADDVLAKWMALTADERRLIADANMHLPGHQVDPQRVARDLDRLARWEGEQAKRQAPSSQTSANGTWQAPDRPTPTRARGFGPTHPGAGSVRAA